MKIKYFYCFLIILIFFSHSAYPYSNTKDIIAEADRLISNKKYESAYKLLENYDWENKIPEVFLKKVDIALNYFIFSMNHLLFSFKDLKDNEDLETLRGGNKNFNPVYKLNIVEILSNLIKKEPNNWKYKRVLGYFYFDYFNKFERPKGNSGDATFLSDAKKLLLEAYNHNEYNSKSLRVLGYFDYLDLKFESAIKYFLKSYNLDKEDIYTLYFLSASYFKSNKDDLAIKYATIGLNLKNNRDDLKSELANLLSIIYQGRRDDENAKKYSELSNKLKQ